MASRRQQTKDDKRGNSTDRRNRKIWLCSTPKFGGNGTHVRCVHCGTLLPMAEVEADRINPGGSYRRDNIQPACGADNRARSNNAAWVSPMMNALALAAQGAADRA
jgi:hypothetical protein